MKNKPIEYTTKNPAYDYALGTKTMIVLLIVVATLTYFCN